MNCALYMVGNVYELCIIYGR